MEHIRNKEAMPIRSCLSWGCNLSSLSLRSPSDYRLQYFSLLHITERLQKVIKVINLDQLFHREFTLVMFLDQVGNHLLGSLVHAQDMATAKTRHTSVATLSPW